MASPPSPPHRAAIPVQYPAHRIGSKVVKVSPEKIAAVVLNYQSDGVTPFKEPTEETLRIGRNIVRFLEGEYVNGRLPREFPPLQSGLGNVANAALAALGHSAAIPPFSCTGTFSRASRAAYSSNMDCESSVEPLFT